jgi:hypothetical protein
MAEIQQSTALWTRLWKNRATINPPLRRREGKVPLWHANRKGSTHKLCAKSAKEPLLRFANLLGLIKQLL